MTVGIGVAVGDGVAVGPGVFVGPSVFVAVASVFCEFGFDGARATATPPRTQHTTRNEPAPISTHCQAFSPPRRGADAAAYGTAGYVGRTVCPCW